MQKFRSTDLRYRLGYEQQSFKYFQSEKQRWLRYHTIGTCESHQLRPLSAP